MNKKRLYIYVSGPYRGSSSKEIIANKNRADAIGREIAVRGHIPFIPHTMLDPWQDIDRRFTHETILELDRNWLDLCDAIFFIASSKGADKELQYAKERGKIIFKKIEELPNL